MTRNLDCTTLKFEKIIIHNIPRHKKSDKAEADCSDNFSNLTEELESIFRDKITNSVNSNKALNICKNPGSPSPVRDLIEEMITSEDKFIQNSKEMAKHLFNCQNGSNTSGLLVLLKSSLQNKGVIIVLKLEKDTGVKIEKDNRNHSYTLEAIRNIMLTQKTKLFKFALLFGSEWEPDYNYNGILMDYQIQTRKKNDITSWFLDKFLGYIAADDPRITTKKFYSETKAYILTIKDIDSQIKYLNDLNSYLLSNNNMISPKDFAEGYLSPQEERDYITFMEGKGIASNSFFKDTLDIKNEIKAITIEFQGGTRLTSVTPQKEVIDIKDVGNGEVIASIKGRLKRVK